MWVKTRALPQATVNMVFGHNEGLKMRNFEGGRQTVLSRHLPPLATFSTPLPIRYTAPLPGLWFLEKGVIMGALDILVFVAFVVSVISIGLWKSKGEETHSEHGAQDYFLAGRGLTWWLIGFSLIAANISTEQFVGMSGKAADWLGWPSPATNGWPRLRWSSWLSCSCRRS
jgi:hypothetical protein